MNFSLVRIALHAHTHTHTHTHTHRLIDKQTHRQKDTQADRKKIAKLQKKKIPKKGEKPKLLQFCSTARAALLVKDKKRIGFWRRSQVAVGLKIGSDVPGEKAPLRPCFGVIGHISSLGS